MRKLIFAFGLALAVGCGDAADTGAGEPVIAEQRVKSFEIERSPGPQAAQLRASLPGGVESVTLRCEDERFCVTVRSIVATQSYREVGSRGPITNHKRGELVIPGERVVAGEIEFVVELDPLPQPLTLELLVRRAE